jgi:hypothetical protein
LGLRQQRADANYFTADGVSANFGVTGYTPSRGLVSPVVFWAQMTELLFTNVPRAQAVRWAVESSREIFDCADVEACGILSVITTLEFFQHDFA